MIKKVALITGINGQLLGKLQYADLTDSSIINFSYTTMQA